MNASKLARTYMRVLDCGSKNNAWSVLSWCREFNSYKYRPMGPIGYEPGGIPGITAFYEHGLLMMFEQRQEASKIAMKMNRGTEELVVHKVVQLSDLRFDFICDSPNLTPKKNVSYCDALRMLVTSRELYPSHRSSISLHEDSVWLQKLWAAA